MNCLNRYELQPYIDNEVSQEEREAFELHLEGCKECSGLYADAKEEVTQVKQALSLYELPYDEIPIPAFKQPKNKHTWLSSFSAAACFALIIGTYFTLNNNILKSRQINQSELEVEQMLYQCDPNKLWNDKQPVITVTNEQGEIIYSSINN